MIHIIASICSIVVGSHCQDLKLSFEKENITPFACFTYGQIELAKWTEDHPNWYITKWKCTTKNEENL